MEKELFTGHKHKEASPAGGAFSAKRSRFAIIVAGGCGMRAGGGLPKQFHIVCGRPMLFWSLKAFYRQDPDTGIIVVLHPDYIELWQQLVAELPFEEQIPHSIAPGGAERSESVANGLNLLASAAPQSLVAIHDAARPLVSTELIERGWLTSAQYGTAVPVVAMTDSLRRVHSPGESSVVDRKEYVAVQTPQVFTLEIAHAAHAQKGFFTDDASMAEKAGFKIALFEGERTNMKVTTAEDFVVCEALMQKIL